MKVTFFSSNPAKIDEAHRIFKAYSIDLQIMHFDFIEIQDLSHEKVILHKVSQLPTVSDEIHVVDDTGLYLETYANFPGVMTKFVYETLGYEGFLSLLTSKKNRRGSFRTLVAVKTAQSIKIFEGVCKGEVATTSRGKPEEGLLFEPLFIPEDASVTLAEMTLDQRSKYSYRAKAFQSAADYIKKLLGS